MLAKQFQPVHPIIRIPRLTKDELSSICVNDDEIQSTIVPTISKENELPTNDIEPLNDTESSIALPTEPQIVKQQSAQKNKFCSICKHEFSHRSGYLRHVKIIHNGIFPPMPDFNNPVEGENSRIEETPVSTNDQSVISAETENAVEDEFLDVSNNQWGIADDRLRPRPFSKSKNDSMSKVKCDVCNKFFRASYIKRHQNRTHRGSRSSSSSELNDSSDQTRPISDKPMNEPQTTADGSSTNTTTLVSTVALAEMDIDDIPVRFRKDSNKAIVIAATCLERYQLDIIEEFLKKFPNRVTQSTTVDSRTTHLITNDDQQLLRSPLSIKLIEAIAHHCFCVSYRWIIDCLKYDRIVDENIYEIEGDTTDYHPHGGPKRSRLIEKRHSLFENICFMIKCTENSEIKMTNDRLQDLITTCGGKIITCVTQNFLEQFTVVVLCDKLYVSERRHNYDQCRGLGIRFVSSDWVLESILEYRQKPFLSYEETPL